MENISIPTTAQNNSFAGAAAPRTDVQRAEALQQRVISTQETQQTPLDGRDQEQARFDAVKRASNKIVNTNPLSPSIARFTIYRDTLADGVVFVTRFTHIETGKVTMVREGDLLVGLGAGKGAILDGTV